MPVPAALRTVACLALAAGVYATVPDPPALRASLALFALVGGLWLTQAIPLVVTALLVPTLAAAAGLLEVRAAFAPFAHPTIFLFLGGFGLATALHHHGLDRAIAHAVLRAAGGRQGRAMTLLAAVTALLSMWMSNTATAAMMLPLALGLLGEAHADGGAGTGNGARGEEDARDRTQTPAADAAAPPAAGHAGDRPAANEARGSREAIYVLLALAYSASIGGMASIVGSPPNAIAAAQGGIGFAQWLARGVPMALLLWVLAMLVLRMALRPRFGGTIAVPAERLAWTRARVLTVAIFSATVLAWVFGAPMARALGIRGDIDAWVAVTALVTLVATGCLRWPQAERGTEWGVLLLFGGGLALSEVMQASGATRFLVGHVLQALQGAPLVLVLAGVVVFVILLSELLSNTASAALVLPVFLPAAAALGVPQDTAAFTIAIAASCGFMLPVATPPNGLVYATGRVPPEVMMRCGFWLNLVCALAVCAAAWTMARAA